MLREGERLDDLICSGLKIIQSKSGFCFSIDSVLLANFAYANKGDRILDLGTGSGVIAILMSAKTEASKIIGVEIQDEAADRAYRSVLFNNLEDKIKILKMDMKDLTKVFDRDSIDVIVTNPPYMELGKGLINPDSVKAISRHEIKINLKEIISISNILLKKKGKFFMVHRPERLGDILFYMRTHGIEPKRLRFVHPYSNKNATAVLVEGLKGGQKGMVVLNPLIVYEIDGGYTQEINKIYFGSNGEA